MQACVPSRLFSGLAFAAGAALLALSTVMASGASAQTAGGGISIDNTGDAKSEMAACQSGRTQQSRATCMTEVRKAQAAKRAGRLENYGDLTANALKRCEIFKTADDMAACRARVEQGRLSGSVAEGGILREAEIQVMPDMPAMPETAPRPAPPAPQ